MIQFLNFAIFTHNFRSPKGILTKFPIRTKKTLNVCVVYKMYKKVLLLSRTMIAADNTPAAWTLQCRCLEVTAQSQDAGAEPP